MYLPYESLALDRADCCHAKLDPSDSTVRLEKRGNPVLRYAVIDPTDPQALLVRFGGPEFIVDGLIGGLHDARW